MSFQLGTIHKLCRQPEGEGGSEKVPFLPIMPNMFAYEGGGGQLLRTQTIVNLKVTVVCISLGMRLHYLAGVFIFVKIQKLLIYGLKHLKICHKFQH